MKLYWILTINPLLFSNHKQALSHLIELESEGFGSSLEPFYDSCHFYRQVFGIR